MLWHKGLLVGQLNLKGENSLKWNKLSFVTTTQAVDIVSNMLDEMGIEGIEIEDNIPITEEEKEAMFIDILPEIGKDDGTAKISFYIDVDLNTEDIIKRVTEGLKELETFVDVGDKLISVSETEDKDWINNWKEFFKPFRVDDNIIIKPTWEKLEDSKDTDLIIEIDPGTAFGTGAHETTRLCIQGLKKYITSDTKLLDIGCGSGILSIIGLKLGAESAVGIDIDPNAVNVTYENAEVNGINMEQFKILSGNIINDTKLQDKVGMERYDIVVANILADVIIPLSKEVGKHLKSGGLFITSGIINTRKEDVKQEIINSGFEIVDINELGEWVSIVARK